MMKQIFAKILFDCVIHPIVSVFQICETDFRFMKHANRRKLNKGNLQKVLVEVSDATGSVSAYVQRTNSKFGYPCCIYIIMREGS